MCAVRHDAIETCDERRRRRLRVLYKMAKAAQPRVAVESSDELTARPVLKNREFQGVGPRRGFEYASRFGRAASEPGQVINWTAGFLIR